MAHAPNLSPLTQCALALLSATAAADNPVVQTHYTADPAPMVHDGRLYLYTGHDEDSATNWFTMNEWRVYSTVDMVNWTHHGSPLRYSDFTWAKGDAWAGQCIARNGKFYYYVPVTQKNGGMAIGVAVSSSPTGPFKDALGHPLVSTGTGDIDPTAFIDDDGQAYLYWGNPRLWYVKLNEDMISYSGKAEQVPLTAAGFGARTGDASRSTLYEEGPWFFRRGELYYLMNAAGGIPENIAYSTSTGPTGPWTYRGVIMPAEGASFTNHAGVVDFEGRSYFFYHNGALPGGSGFHRSVAVEPFTFNADGSFPTIKMTKEGPPAIRDLDPYVATEAETLAWGSGIETEACSEGGLNVTSINHGDSIKVKSVDFGTGAVSFEARVASASSGGAIGLHLDSLSSPATSSCEVQSTGGWQTWVTTSCAVTGLTGRHDLYLKFTGGSGSLFNFNWWRFVSREPSAHADAGSEDPDPRPRDGGAGGTDTKDGGALGPLDGGGATSETDGGDGDAPRTDDGGAGGQGIQEHDVVGSACQSGLGPRDIPLGLLYLVLVAARRRRSSANALTTPSAPQGPPPTLPGTAHE
jgi:hypothetical protein